MNIFQVPRKDEERRQVIIGVIDCSGSMEPSWPWLVDHWNRCVPRENLRTITFDSKTSKVPNNQLNVDILEHGGGGTKIVEAFELLEAELAAIPKEVHVTVLFISDGEDNDAKSLEQRFGRLKGSSNGRLLNFLCLGVGDEFPTFLAMRLRSLYHSGDPTIPAILLIEFPSEQAFTNKFEQLAPFFEMNLPRRVTPAVCALPWRIQDRRLLTCSSTSPGPHRPRSAL